MIIVNNLLSFSSVPPPASVSLTSTPSSPVNSAVITCTLVLHSAILDSDLSLLTVSAQMTHPNGNILSLSNTTRGTTFTYTAQLNSFGRSDSGNYTCNATVGSEPSLIYVTGSETLSAIVNIKAGIYILRL